MSMKMLAALFILVGCAQALAKDGFENVRCGGDLAKALVGQHGSDEPVAKIEARHKDLGLKDLGADEISDTLSSISWRICGRNVVVLEDNRTSLIRDALEVPPSSKANPAFNGICQVKGKDMATSVIAILRDQPGAALLPVDVAWKIDEKQKKFVKIPTADLACPRDGIVPSDGGG